MNDLRTAPAIVVMGVAGCGKTAVGEALAKALGADFIEGDLLHPPENVARMARGEPLTDALRAGWLDAIGERIATSVADGRKAVAACSALKRSYRDRLSRFCPGMVFLYLRIDRETAWRRVADRKGHFMPASLVDSQFATLEEPTADEQAVAVDGTRSVAGILQEIIR
ncbi:gluconokinase [Mesorhizobium sp. CA18]|uniref:gluconokinase n=1 Tax=unclassified Mesorhizobium TaxID=325217 RepID=UPI001CC965AF|nr:MULTISPECIES: gluconokinase [unclassified Mesorhizobium]MBZ9732641.1 gluconokinase [Mesorhizobium sp. CA9]MBZ9828282.1 gluconokinase [Mesorhizobium sp. CA18]MBZ9830308.1 gluconokinase [Mesorhizobium sp. CA2]MBZ9835594.1 gluconokinase [Mesorhizobium sp. CA3]MBZ9875722.1 gluconokinase [Mesorhizobium sp. Ca11]